MTLQPIKIFEKFEISKHRKFRTILYTPDWQTFYVESYEGNMLKRMHMMRLKEKATEEEIFEARNEILKIANRHGAWKLTKMLIIIALVHAKNRHGTKNPKNVIKCIETNAKISTKMIGHTIKEIGW